MKNLILIFCFLLFSGTVLAISPDYDVGNETELVIQTDMNVTVTYLFVGITTNHKSISADIMTAEQMITINKNRNPLKKDVSIQRVVQNGTSGGCADKQI